MARLKSSSSSKSPLPSPKNKSPNPKPPNKSTPNPNPKTPAAADHGGKSSGSSGASVKGLTKEQEEEDYMRILQAVADFTARNGSIPTPSTMKPVYEAVKGELHQKELTVEQLYNKFRNLKERYRRILDSGVGPASADRAFFDLSVMAWGELKRKNPPPSTSSKEMVEEEEEMNNKRSAKKPKVYQEEEKKEEKKKKRRRRNDEAAAADDADAGDNVAAANEMENDKEEEKKKKKKKRKNAAAAAVDDTDANDNAAAADEMENDKEEKGKEEEDGGDDHKFRYLRDQATKFFKLYKMSMKQLELGLKFMDKSKAEVLEMKWRKFMDMEMKNESRAHNLNKDLLAALSFYFRKV